MPLGIAVGKPGPPTGSVNSVARPSRRAPLAEVSVPDILDDTRADPHEREMACEASRPPGWRVHRGGDKMLTTSAGVSR
jgi:hypothetical protein